MRWWYSLKFERIINPQFVVHILGTVQPLHEERRKNFRLLHLTNLIVAPEDARVTLVPRHERGTYDHLHVGTHDVSP